MEEEALFEEKRVTEVSIPMPFKAPTVFKTVFRAV
jgi:hypothetical protein